VILWTSARRPGENPAWGYDRVQGALSNLAHLLSDRTVGNILKAHGMEPAPDRLWQSRCKSFFSSHWEAPASLNLGDRSVDENPVGHLLPAPFWGTGKPVGFA
jgi:hypothetical protein